MVLVSYSGREINAKLVYYGPGLSGKTTNLEYIYTAIPQTHRGKMVSMKTKTERTLFFDFLPIQLGELSGFKTRFLLYTVPGQVYYNATRKLVLKGVDAVVFVADSKRGKMDENIESLQNLRDNLREHGLDLDRIPWVIQYNKRDLPDVYSIEELERALNPGQVPCFEAAAKSGSGVVETFKAVSRMLLRHISQEIGVRVVQDGEKASRPEATQAAGDAPGSHEAAAGTRGMAEEAAPRPVPVSSLRGPARSHERMPEPKVVEQPGQRIAPAADLRPEPFRVEMDASGTAETVEPAPPAPALSPSPAPEEEPAHLAPLPAAAEAGRLPVERVGSKLRRWLSRPRDGEDREEGLGLEPERRPALPPPFPLRARSEEGLREPADSTLSLARPPEGTTDLPAREAEASARCREVPILVDLDPEDLQRGVTLKLRIAVRRTPEQARVAGASSREDRAA